MISGPKPFRFFNMWTEHELFLETMSQPWDTRVEGSDMFKLWVKLLMVIKKKSGVQWLDLGDFK